MNKIIDLFLWLSIAVIFILSVYSVFLESLIALMCFSSIIVFLVPPVRRIIFPMIFKEKNTLKRRVLYSAIYIALLGSVIVFSLKAADFSKLNPYTGNYKFKKPARYFEGTLNIDRTDRQVLMKVATNAPDNALFELSLVNDDQKVLSSVESVTNGEIIREFFIPDDWGTSLVLCNAVMPFNFPSIQQSKAVKSIYGENGSKMKSLLAEENNLNGFNGVLKSQYFAYPDNQSYIDKTMKNLVKSSNLIKDIRPESETNGWASTVVVFTEEWDNTEETEKKQIKTELEKSLIDFLKVHTGNRTIKMKFVNSSGKVSN